MAKTKTKGRKGGCFIGVISPFKRFFRIWKEGGFEDGFEGERGGGGFSCFIAVFIGLVLFIPVSLYQGTIRYDVTLSDGSNHTACLVDYRDCGGFISRCYGEPKRTQYECQNGFKKIKTRMED